MATTRRGFANVCILISFVAVLALAPPFPSHAGAQEVSAELVTKPGALPEMVLGSANAPLAIVYYGSLTCEACSERFEDLMTLVSKYADAGKVRFIFRELALDSKALAGSMLARCISGSDASTYVQVLKLVLHEQKNLIANPGNTLKQIAAQSGLNQEAFEGCMKNAAMLEKMNIDRKFAFEVLKVPMAPFYFVVDAKNGTVADSTSIISVASSVTKSRLECSRNICRP